MTPSPEVAWNLQCLLGEGPVWLEEGQLRFVDIKRGNLHRFDPTTGVRETTSVGGKPSFIVQASDGSLLIGSGHAIHKSSGEELGPELLHIVEAAGNRTNDATVDHLGRLWFGTMNDDERQRSGAFWCYDRGVLSQAGPTAVVTNGPAVSIDGRWLYHVDSSEGIVWRAALGDAAKLVGSEPFVTLPKAIGSPDGIVVDSEDCLWVALWDGWGVRRYAPDGTLLLHVALPCARVTKIAFGGQDLKTAFVTTARVGLGEKALAEQPLAGALFSFEAPAAGQRLPSVVLPA